MSFFRKKIHFLYKATEYFLFCLKSLYCTTLLKIKFYLNRVVYGTGIKANNAVPLLSINKNFKQFVIGTNATFNSFHDSAWYCKSRINVREGASLTIGENFGINGAEIFCAREIFIGNHVKIGGGTRISDSNHHSLDFMDRRLDNNQDKIKKEKIVIEDDVFIGAGCFIGKGVTIGARSIIAQGSVVVKSIPADCIAGGNPCKVIKSLI